LPQEVANGVGDKLKIAVEDHLSLKKHGIKKGDGDPEQKENAKGIF
jgi:hypothetical protein